MYGLQKGNIMVYNIGLECGAAFCGIACNAYLVVGDKNIIIDTVPAEYGDEFIRAIEKYVPLSEIDSVFLLSVLPSRAGALSGLLSRNPDITVYATAAGLRNLSEITDLEFRGRVCKNGVEVAVGSSDFVPYITPNLTSPETMILFYKQIGALYTGELFSSSYETGKYHEGNLRPFVSYILPALETIESINPSYVYPLYGSCDNINGAFEFYREFAKADTNGDFVLVVYSSNTGNNETMAKFAEAALLELNVKTKLICLDSLESSTEAARELGRSCGLVLCLPTENRTMPKSVWDFLSFADVNLVSGKPYVVSSSYGWSSEGAYMANEILSMLKMRRVCKFIESIFTPTESDKQTFKSGLKALVDFILKQKEKSDNA